MAQVTTRQTSGDVKVSRKVVNTINELSEARAEYEALKSRIEELRNEVLAEVGEFEDKVTLTHNSIEVARISKQARTYADTQLLRKEFPDIWEAVKYSSEACVIRSVTRKK